MQPGLRRYAAAWVLGLGVGAAPAEAQTVGGSVLAEGSGEAVVGARVWLEPVGGTRRVGVLTDARGAFVVPLAGRTARYVIRVEHPSYLPFADTLQLRAQEVVTLKLLLGRDAIPLQPLVVSARIQRRLQGYYERVRQGLGFGRFLTREDLDRIPAQRTSDFLRRIPGVRLEPFGGGRLITLNSPLGECTPLLFFDGIPIEQRGPDEADNRLDPRMLEGIEVYPGSVGLPDEFAAAQPTGCGAVAFWTSDPGGRRLTWAGLLISMGAVAIFIVGSWTILL